MTNESQRVVLDPPPAGRYITMTVMPPAENVGETEEELLWPIVASNEHVRIHFETSTRQESPAPGALSDASR